MIPGHSQKQCGVSKRVSNVPLEPKPIDNFTPMKTLLTLLILTLTLSSCMDDYPNFKVRRLSDNTIEVRSFHRSLLVGDTVMLSTEYGVRGVIVEKVPSK
jgi:hypothetical protein